VGARNETKEVHGMRRILLVIACVFAVEAFATQAALADSPHFVKGPTTSTTVSPDNTITLFVSFKGAGLGNGPYVDWSVTGSGTLFSRCYNHGGNKPQADNKQETVPISATFSTPVNNGQTTATNQVVATITSTLTCPGNQVVKIESFSATGTLTGAGLTADLAWTFPS
jgi:hypothetical protein